MRNPEDQPLLEHEKIGTYAKLSYSLRKNCPENVATAEEFLRLMKLALQYGVFSARMTTIVQEVYFNSDIEKTFYAMLAGAVLGSLCHIFRLNITKSEDRKKLNNLLDAIIASGQAVALVGMAIPIAIRIAGMVKPGQWGNSAAANAEFLGAVLAPSLLAGLMNLPVIRRFIYKNFKDQEPRWLNRTVRVIDELLRNFITSYQLMEMALFFGNVFERQLVVEYNNEIGLARLILAGSSAIALEVALLKKPETRTWLGNIIAKGALVSIPFVALNYIIEMAETDKHDENRSNRALLAGVATTVITLGMLVYAKWQVSHKKTNEIQEEKNVVAIPKEQLDNQKKIKAWIESFKKGIENEKGQLSQKGKQENNKEGKQEETEPASREGRKQEIKEEENSDSDLEFK